MAISDNIKKLRTQHGMSQEEFGKIAGVSDKAVSTWENGKKEPRMGAIQKIALYFNINKSEIIDDAEASRIPVSGMIPIVGKIPAGYPVLAEENIEGYMPTMVKNPNEYFYLRVSGVSMINAGIPDGALVLIHKQQCAENGEIVACRVNGDEATLKRFKPVNNDTVVLMPENPDFQPIIVSGKDFKSGYAEIIGVAKQVTTNL